MKSALASKEEFYAAYRKLTVAASSEFELADRIRTVNRLSAQLALLDYQLGDFKSAASQLESIPSLYSRQGWDLISTSLLSIYVKCLEQLNRKEDLLVNSMELLCNHKYLKPDDVEVLSESVQKLFDVVEWTSGFEGLFEITILPYIHPLPESGKYCLTVNVSSPILTKDFELDNASLKLISLSSNRDLIELVSETPIISGKGMTKLQFTTNNFTKGRFRVEILELKKKKISFTKSFSSVNCS